MKTFFTSLFASFIAMILFTVLIIVILVVGIGSMSKEEKTKVEPNTLLYLKMSGEIVERSENDFFESMGLPFNDEQKQTGLWDILESIKKAGKDPKIAGIYINLQMFDCGLGFIEEIRNSLLEFKKTNKKIICYSEFYTNKSYYLASVADSIFINPEGEILINGLGADLLFFKGLLDKIGVKPEILRHGKYKSATEPLFLDKMSEANKEQFNAFLGSNWKHIIEGISKERGISEEEINLIADKLSIRSTSDAKEKKLIDRIYYKDQVIRSLNILSKQKAEDAPILMSVSEYMKAPKILDKDKKVAKDKIAIIYISSEMVSGKGSNNNPGSDVIAAAIRKAANDNKVKAIVLRINSPGGASLAADIMWREVKLAKKKKPVIASMGNVAASGGYYVACAADTIIANPTTITGSIGVFGVMVNIKKLLNEKLGITSDHVGTNAYTDLGNPMRELSTFERDFITSQVDAVYETFTQHVAEGRKMTQQKVDSLGQGRIWSGVHAYENGLVDAFGGIQQAIEIAAKSAKLTHYRVVAYPEKQDPFSQIFDNKKTDKLSEIKKEIGFAGSYLETMMSVMKLEGIQARLPYEFTID